ncbi:hypothetical protein BBJ29_002920 [Phytophthora kernoviae]|uniref:SIS domain-containing protein n=1 Tax=Phytophthora kernoviae TaxID=325452 RepID=A0A3F2RMU3_9STRA|nr:hypothetical protein BBJ29_002920 [Phytophthora kernoviae]RLN60725.1 hypothetical protein BBP00_00005831 [Phytophthora kernoviae]
MLRSLTLHAQKRFARRSACCISACSDLRLHGADLGDRRLARKQFSTSDSSAKLPIGNGNAFLRSVASDIQALGNLYQSLANDSDAAQNFQQCVMRILQCHDEHHRVFVTGMGKSGAVAKRLASTLASVSVSSQYVYGGEWIHGELGGLKEGDTAVTAAAEDEAGCPVPSRSIIVQVSGQLYQWWPCQQRSSLIPRLSAPLKHKLYLILAQSVLAFVYITFGVIFKKCTSRQQFGLLLFLPVMKLVFKNLVGRLASDDEETIPVVVVFTVDVFNGLYASQCIQSSRSWRGLQLPLSVARINDYNMT